MIDVYPGYPVANSVMLPMPTLWWLRPVRSAARVGEHSAVVWNSLYVKPLFARRSSVGVGIGPPKVLAAPKPVSSVMMSKTLGAPFGAVTSFGKSGVDSLALRPITPLNCGCGTGSTAEPPDGSVIWSEDDDCCASAGQSPAASVVPKQNAARNEGRCFESEDDFFDGRVGKDGTPFMRPSLTVVLCSPFAACRQSEASARREIQRYAVPLI